MASAFTPVAKLEEKKVTTEFRPSLPPLPQKIEATPDTVKLLQTLINIVTETLCLVSEIRNELVAEDTAEEDEDMEESSPSMFKRQRGAHSGRRDFDQRED